jgi:hypothetical protein
MWKSHLVYAKPAFGIPQHVVTQHMWLATFMQVRSRVPELSIRLRENKRLHLVF